MVSYTLVLLVDLSAFMLRMFKTADFYLLLLFLAPISVLICQENLVSFDWHLADSMQVSWHYLLFLGLPDLKQVIKVGLALLPEHLRDGVPGCFHAWLSRFPNTFDKPICCTTTCTNDCFDFIHLVEVHWFKRRYKIWWLEAVGVVGIFVWEAYIWICTSYIYCILPTYLFYNNIT